MRKVADRKPRIGIARTLIHYLDYFEWEVFFSLLECDVVQSRDSDSSLFLEGFKFTVNDQCYPIKMFYGHIQDLKDKADIIFIPQLISLRESTYSCPKIIGLPQLIEHTMEGLPPIIRVQVDMNKIKDTEKAITRLCKQFSPDQKKREAALSHFRKKTEELKEIRPKEKHYHYPRIKGKTGGKIGVIGHNYALEDKVLNASILEKIRGYGYEYITSHDVVPRNSALHQRNPFGYQQVHWDFGQHIIDVAHQFSINHDIAGIVFLTYFGCGIDSFIEEVFKSSISHKPYLSLTIDEHSGEAGLITRIEAFLDMIQFKNQRTL